MKTTSETSRFSCLFSILQKAKAKKTIEENSTPPGKADPSGAIPKKFHRSAEEIVNAAGKPSAVANVAVIPRKPKKDSIPNEGEETKENDAQAQGSDNPTRGKNWAKNRERRERFRIEKEARQQSNAAPTGNITKGPTSTSLIGAKAAIRDRLNMMYRGMHGLDAAHEAFAICGVGVAVNLADPTPGTQGKRPNPDKATNGGKYGKKKRFEHPKKANKSANPVGNQSSATATEVS